MEPQGDEIQRAARAAVLTNFAWVKGHADVWRLFSDPAALRVITSALAAPWSDDGVTQVCGIESRGFLLGGAVALRLGVGFTAVRKADGILPGAKVERTSAADYRGRSQTLRIQRERLGIADRVVLVDDWAERGSQATAVRELVEACEATFLGLSVIVDQLADDVRAGLKRVHAIVRAVELGPSSYTGD